MRILIIGSNGMLSKALTKYFQSQIGNMVDVYGLDAPRDDECANFYQVNLLKDKIDCDKIVGYDVIFYASGAGVQAALKTDSSLMYALNVNVPIDITLKLKQNGYS